jgi:hypothetical protein
MHTTTRARPNPSRCVARAARARACVSRLCVTVPGDLKRDSYDILLFVIIGYYSMIVMLYLFMWCVVRR